MSRQNYYAVRRLRHKRFVDENLIVELVQQERLVQPRLGGRKLHFLLKPELEKAQIQIGRDRFFEILGKNDLLVPPIKSYHPRTTDSRHSLPIFRNLIKDLEITGPNQVWVSDLTYIRTDEGFVFASLITDAYSHKIVGSYISDSLESIGCQQALKQALSELPAGKKPIHHSDRGCQYCCHAYVELVEERGMSISMTEENHCAENAMAERVNGILKQEYGLGGNFRTKAQVKKAFKQAVWVYNNRRPHSVLNNQFPSVVHAKAA